MYFSRCICFFAVLTFSHAASVCEKDAQFFQAGETYSPPGECVKYSCAENGALTAVGCGEFQVDTASGWTKSDVDLSKPYPDCCPKAVPPPTTAAAAEAVCIKDGVLFQVGETYSPRGECIQYTCAEGGVFTALGCGLIAVPKGWTVTSEDPSKPYPDCCPKAVPLVLS